MTVLAAWKRFGEAAMWQSTWSWCLVVVRRLAAWLRRTAMRYDTDALGHPDELADARMLDPLALVAGEDFVVDLTSRLDGPDRETVALLRAGVVSNGEIALVRAVSLRSVELSRERLRKLADDLRKVSRGLRAHRSPGFLYL